jgi:hypothetical protein
MVGARFVQKDLNERVVEARTGGVKVRMARPDASPDRRRDASIDGLEGAA